MQGGCNRHDYCARGATSKDFGIGSSTRAPYEGGGERFPVTSTGVARCRDTQAPGLGDRGRVDFAGMSKEPPSHSRKSEPSKMADGDELPLQDGCLFCRRTDGGFTSREHVFSESFGNQTYVLPPGVVCDRCNNGPLSVVDNALASFPPFALLRAERGIGGKRGIAPVMDIGGTQVWFSAPCELNVQTNSRKVTSGMNQAPGGTPEGTLNLKGYHNTPQKCRDMTRAIWKSALELIFWDGGAAVAMDPRFDGARQATLDSRAQGWCVLAKQAEVGGNNAVTLKYDYRTVDGREALPVGLSVFGALFYTDLLRRDLREADIQPPFDSNVWVF